MDLKLHQTENGHILIIKQEYQVTTYCPEQIEEKTMFCSIVIIEEIDKISINIQINLTFYFINIHHPKKFISKFQMKYTIKKNIFDKEKEKKSILWFHKD